jgi:hypothetical protein
LSSGRRVTDRQVSALEFGGPLIPLIKVDLPRRWRAGTAGNDPKRMSGFDLVANRGIEAGD